MIHVSIHYLFVISLKVLYNICVKLIARFTLPIMSYAYSYIVAETPLLLHCGGGAATLTCGGGAATLTILISTSKVNIGKI